MIIYNFSDKHLKQILELYREMGWSEGRSMEEINKCLKNSQLSVGIVDENNNLNGFARVITDFVYKALILDVMVKTAHQGKGLGKKLMSIVKNHETLKKVKHFELYCLPEMEPFYSSFGFTTDVEGIKLMRFTNS